MGARVDRGEIRRLREEGLRNCDIAQRLGCCESTVDQAVRKMNLARRSSGPRKPIDVPLLFELWSTDLSYMEIAQRMGVSVSTIALLRKHHGLPLRMQRRKESVTDDPTPAEIEERSRQCRERHYAQRRSEKECNTSSKVSKWNMGLCMPRGGRHL